jgi:hypothetical protein
LIVEAGDGFTEGAVLGRKQVVGWQSVRHRLKACR